MCSNNRPFGLLNRLSNKIARNFIPKNNTYSSICCFRDLGDGRFKDVYAETVKMSTYLAAFVVSDFDFVENGSQKVYARPEAVKDGLADYGLKAGVELLKIIEDFVQVNYSLQKMDQISFPDEYFAAGAMENWGLVTYRYVFKNTVY